LLDDNGVITIAPHIGASVEAKVLQHLKGDKVIVSKEEEKDTKEKWSQTVSPNCNRRYYCSRC
jgi:large subunit ribosomal protein L21